MADPLQGSEIAFETWRHPGLKPELETGSGKFPSKEPACARDGGSMKFSQGTTAQEHPAPDCIIGSSITHEDTAMKKIILAACCATLMGLGTAAAQTSGTQDNMKQNDTMSNGSMSKDQMPKGKMAKSKTSKHKTVGMSKSSKMKSDSMKKDEMSK